jgi:hypothetical protein
MSQEPELRETHISQIRVGDTVFHDGALRTVGAKDIKRCDFMGCTLFGDSYILGQRPIKIAIMELVNETPHSPCHRPATECSFLTGADSA